jgi:hypothetical protein
LIEHSSAEVGIVKPAAPSLLNEAKLKERLSQIHSNKENNETLPLELFSTAKDYAHNLSLAIRSELSSG